MSLEEFYAKVVISYEAKDGSDQAGANFTIR